MTSIEHHHPQKQAPLLQACVTATIDLALSFKHLHWNIRGPRFRSVHEFLDIVIEHARDATDELAERLVTIGMPAEGQRTELDKSPVPAIESGFLTDEAVLKHAVAILDETIKVLRDAQSKLGDLDAVSEDIVIGTLANLEKDLWMLSSQLGSAN
ncbi:MAG: DNA starvation/stationary phase protection protein [Phycisphaerales bacterium JB052]